MWYILSEVIKMGYEKLRKEVSDYYKNYADERSKDFLEKCTAELDREYREDMSVFEMKTLQYKKIADMLDPIIFENCPFYYETGTLSAHCDGARDFHGVRHAGGWTYFKNEHRFIEKDEELWNLRCRQMDELFYLICGPYNDTSQHFDFYYRPIFETGLSGVAEKAKKELEKAETQKEKDFLNAVCDGLSAVKKVSEKFAEKAGALFEKNPNNKNLKRIADSAKRCPWEKPESFYEALNTYAFMRKVIGTLEGIGTNTFGRIDMDLYPFYERDIKAGRISEREAYDLICQFLIMFDCHYNHDMKMVGYADHELENTYTLGGCDSDGNPVYNTLTKMFLKATREEKVIFPKIKCRYSKNSPKEYLDEINIAVVNGTSTVLYQNDDATIPALLRAGRSLSEARDYIVTGCWGLMINGIEKPDGGTYVNMLKPFEYSLHKRADKMKKVGMNFIPIDDAKSFNEVYNITLDNIDTLFKERIRITTLGGNMWDEVDVVPIFSSTLSDCIGKRMDYTSGGARRRDDKFLCFGLPDIVDSLLAIKTLCFDEKKYTLTEMLAAVRSNWDGYDGMRQDAIHCSGWGDGKKESCELAKRFNDDLYERTQRLTGSYGGKVLMGHLTYTEIRWWGEETLATPNGRKNGDYFSQGLTPSRLKKIESVTDVINSLSAIDKTTLAANSVVNIIIPKVPLDICEAFLRTAADSAIESLQLNCTTKEQLLDAQKHPEKYPDLIVRVCGFSAKFTSLSPEWQNEVITRNFYEG